MTKPPKTVFDFPREQWPSLEIQNSDGGWDTHREWSTWNFSYVANCEARLVKREPRTVSGECAKGWRDLKLWTVAGNLSGELPIRYTITEVIEGADPEPDWKAECERLTKCVNKLVDAHQQDRKLIAQRDTRIGELEEEKSNLLNSFNHNMNARIEKDNRIRELEGSLAASAAAVQKLEAQVSNERAHSCELQQALDANSKERATLAERASYLEETLKAGARAAEVTF
jgi:hypothetical protein